MNEIGKEYGTALFMLACEEDKKKEYSEILENLKSIFLQNPQYIDMLSSPSIPLKERLNLIETVFSNIVPQTIVSYLMLLCEKARITYVVESIDEYKALFDQSEQLSIAKITSVVELTPDEKQKLINKLEQLYKKRVQAEYFIDSTLLGGVLVEVDGKIIDGSLRHRLYDVKEVIDT